MENTNCRLCLKTYKRMKTLNESKDGVPYWLMVNSISDIKLSGADLDEKVCVSCCRRLVEAYNFKLLIESSTTTLQNSNNTKRINFNNIEDIKLEMEIPDNRVIQDGNLLDDINTEDGQFNYNGTVIRRVCNNDQKPLSVVDFLNSFKEQSEDEGYAVDMENDDDDDEPGDNHYDPGDENYDPGDDHNDPGDENYEPDDKTHNPDDGEDEDNRLLIPLNKRKTRNRIYDEIKPRVVRSTKKLSNNDDYDDDYMPEYAKMMKKKPKKKEIKRPKGRPSHCTVLPTPIQPLVLDNVVLSVVNEDKVKPDKEMICHHCGKMFDKAYMKSHLETHIYVVPKFKCDKCQKVYKSMNLLKSHKKVHGPKSFKCELCVATFVHRYGYLSHMKYHTNEKNFVCELCSKAFKVPYLLKKHKLHAHNIGMKELKCEVCDKLCKTKQLLEHHSRVHTGERPYKCEICSQPYSYKHDFNRHCLKKHGVFFKHRSVYVMNEDVLLKERALMRDFMLNMKDNLPENPFEGPQGHVAYRHMVKYLQNQQLPVDF